MSKYIFLIMCLCGCGSGGGTETYCSDNHPLSCNETGACCAAGLPYYCDGYCYAYVPGRCVELDFCEWE
jgi:hypothetical protein